MGKKLIKTALISVYHKDGLDRIIQLLHTYSVKIISTGGTAEFIEKLGVPVTTVESITGFPSIFGGRVKTLHPVPMGGILKRRGNVTDESEAKQYNIPEIDLVIVDLYPFEETVASGASEEEIIEKIDVGGPSMIRAAAKNFKDVVVIASKEQYEYLEEILGNNNETTLEERKYLAGCAFAVTQNYDFAIKGYFNGRTLRYGENPHQSGMFIGDLSKVFDILQGKEISYNNILDTEAAIRLIKDFTMPCFAILKHTNVCGCATGDDGVFALAKRAYDADRESAYGGIFITNQEVTDDVARYFVEEIKLFFEVIIAPSFTPGALNILMKKKNIRVLKLKDFDPPEREIRTSLNGFLVQSRDTKIEPKEDFKVVTKRAPTEREKDDMVIAMIISKHLKSNNVVIVKNGNMITMNAGQVSRISALKYALMKAIELDFDVRGAVMASEAFLPMPDCVEMAGKAGITAVVQPGGSIKDQDSIDKADELGMAMVTTGVRHFKH